MALPAVLPTLPAEGVTITTNDRFRYNQNECVVSYSYVWWNWTHWEREIDWMAMSGLNFVLTFNAQGAIWQKVYTELGFTQKEIDDHYTGPAYLAFQRMGNIQGWTGPLNMNWHKQQTELQKKIVK